MSRTVLTVVSTLARCGPVNVVKSIVEHYCHAKYRPVIATLSPERSTSRVADFLEMGVSIEPLGLSLAGSVISGGRRLREVAERVGAAIVHCHGLRADLLAAYVRLDCTKLSTIHADLERDYQYSYGTFQGAMMANREYAALRRFDAVVAVSETAALRARELGMKLAVIPNGVDVDIYTPPSNCEEVRRIREGLGWPDDRFVILHTGVLIKRKQPLGIVTAFQSGEISRNAMLVFVGEGELLEKCRQAAAGQPNIRFLGHRADLSVLLRAADAVVSNSTSEGLPMALLEACACGLRVLASDIEAHRYIAGLFPEQVELFPLGGAALADRMNALSVSGRTGPIQPPAGSLEAISARRMSRHYQDLYDSAISTGRFPVSALMS